MKRPAQPTIPSAGDFMSALLEHFTGCKVVDVTPQAKRKPAKSEAA